MAHAYLFPELYAAWLAHPERMPGTVVETKATCDNCAMVSPVGLTRDPGPFKAHLKCCTYFPFIPNFSLGSMFIEKPDVARVRIQTAAKQGILLPLGLFPSPERQNLIEELGSDGFGKRDDLLCPFYDSAKNGCSVWRQRPAVCTTYFCKSDRGESGLEFWAQMESYLNHFEWVLSSEVFTRMGFSDEDMEMCKATMMSEPDEREHFIREAWGKWYKKDEEFFKLCFHEASKVSPLDVGRLLDHDHLLIESSLRESVRTELANS